MSDDWKHPLHKRGIKSPGIFDTMVTGPLTNKKIDHYSKSGFYRNRRYYRGELRKIQAQKKFYDLPKKKKLVYNPMTQEFDEREF